MRNLTEYHRPNDLATALDLLSRPGAVALGGGTHVVAERDRATQAVIDLRDLGLSYIREEADGLHIGATTTLQDLCDAPVLHDFAGGLIARTAHSTTSGLLRRACTIAGNLLADATTSDLVTALLVLDAEVVVVGSDERRVRLAKLYDSYPALLTSGRLITEIFTARPSASSRTAFERVARTPTDTAIVSVAALIAVENGACQTARLVVGGILPHARRILEAEQQLEGQHLTDELIDRASTAVAQQIEPQSDFRASGDYRRQMAVVLARRAMKAVAMISQENG